MKVISQNMPADVIHKFSMTTPIAPPSTIKQIVGSTIFKTIQTTHMASASTIKKEEQSTKPPPVVQQEISLLTNGASSSLSPINDHYNQDFNMIISDEDDVLDVKPYATTNLTENKMQHITDMHVFHKSMHAKDQPTSMVTTSRSSQMPPCQTQLSRKNLRAVPTILSERGWQGMSGGLHTSIHVKMKQTYS